MSVLNGNYLKMTSMRGISNDIHGIHKLVTITLPRALILENIKKMKLKFFYYYKR